MDWLLFFLFAHYSLELLQFNSTEGKNILMSQSISSSYQHAPPHLKVGALAHRFTAGLWFKL
jgi:hypothetical protein